MPKSVANVVLDAALNHIINNADQLVVCDGEPADYTDATTDLGSGGHALGETAIGPADFTGPADGDTSGRKLTKNAETGIAVDVAGTADHVALVDDTNSVLLHVTTLASAQAVSAGGTMDVSAYDEEIEDPT